MMGDAGDSPRVIASASARSVHLVIGRMVEDSGGMCPDTVAEELGLGQVEGLQCLGSACFVGVPVRALLRDGLGPCRADGLAALVPLSDVAEARRLCAALPREWAGHPRLGPLGPWLLLSE